MLDLVPPRSSSPPPPSPPPSPRVVLPYSGDLPDELLRQIFELAVILNRHTAKNFMQVSKWVRAWVIHAFYEIVFVKNDDQIYPLASRPEHLLAKIQSLHNALRLKKHSVEFLQRLPNIKQLALQRLPRNHHSRPLEQLLHPDVRLREFVLLNVERGSYRSDVHYPFMTFSSPTFSTLTHLRLGHVYKNLVDQLASSAVPVLPVLTHLSFDACAEDGERAADDYRRILGAPSRVDLQMLVVVVFPGGETHTAQLFALRLSRLVVLMDSAGPLKSRGGEWLAAARGESGFWERAARLGRTFRDAFPFKRVPV
ncbi:hypothetical protein EXIGLDRAFT_728451 [Exidia glandulosa HHB12029]|uniref:F-box domain-containing protein n=1 Tax=Exidia glandulosa HHB12029 TaxID=1314781 RepID=A0A165CXF8_EXIGL|nr:hypothetical protein EXIGLDRAFT_728451 [Exidia glandulosa HHB12029]